MITVITGTPGSGKTLYCIQKLLLPIVGTHVAQDVDGVTTMHPRTIYSNINGLMLDHELIDGSDTGGLRNWHEWAKPGSVIVFDEVQKIWPPRANGSKVPEDIMALETHRHMGVDFILITQGPALIDRNLHMLCGRHLHVRRVANLPFATVYEWDAMARTLNYKAAVNREKYWYNKKVFQLYKSSSLHTKQPRRVPAVLWGLLFAVGLVAWKGPQVYQHIYGEKPPVVVEKKPDTQKPAAPASSPAPAAVAPALLAQPDPPKVSGCIKTAVRCACFTETGDQVEMGAEYCESTTKARPDVLAGGNVDWYQEWKPKPEQPAPYWDGTVRGTQKGWIF